MTQQQHDHTVKFPAQPLPIENDRECRAVALKFAIEAEGRIVSISEQEASVVHGRILSNAKRFEAFIKGEDAF